MSVVFQGIYFQLRIDLTLAIVSESGIESGWEPRSDASAKPPT